MPSPNVDPDSKKSVAVKPPVQRAHQFRTHHFQKKVNAGLLWLGLGLAFLSCHPKEKVVPDPQQQALELIQKKDYDGALLKLNAEMKDHPSDKLRELIASTYAAKAGIFVEDYWNFISGYNTPVVQNQDLSQNADYISLKNILSKIGESDLSESVKTLDLLFQNIAKVQVYAERLKLIPLISLDKQADIKKGLAALEASTSPGAKLYESLLWLIIIRQSIDDGTNSWNSSLALLQQFDLVHLDAPQNRKIICAIDEKGFVAWIRNMSLAISKVAQDLGVAYPSQAPQFEQAQVWLKPLQNLAAPSEVCK